MKSDKAIVFVVDNGYADYLLLALHDVWNGSEREYPIYVIVDHSMKPENIRKIEKFCSKYKIDTRMIIVPKTDTRYISQAVVKTRKTHISPIVYAKVFIADLLPKQIKFAYYFDIDILVMRRFADLMSIEPKKAIAATNHNHPTECERLTGSPGEYFNTGVFVANLDEWRRLDVGAKAKKIIDSYADTLKNLDQDALFLVLKDEWQELPLIYNFYLMRFNTYVENYKRELDWDPDKIKPVIVHFAGPTKPWNGDQRANTYRIWRDRRKQL